MGVRCALVFPGQGSQRVGMGVDLWEGYALSREVFAGVNEALGWDLFRLMAEGSGEELARTEHTQPALMACSLAALAALRGAFGGDLGEVAVAGHSLGEYTALCAGGGFTLESCARVLRLRGQAMQRAVPVGRGAMAAVIGLEVEVVEGVCGFHGCEIANDNAPDQVVISGDRDAVGGAVGALKEAGARRLVPLEVSAPFHCRLMAPAQEEMRMVLSGYPLGALGCPVYSNVSARPETDGRRISELLVAQVTGRVRWRESVMAMVNDGVRLFFELGEGTVLSGLIRRIARGMGAGAVEVISVGDPAGVDRALGRLAAG